MFVRGSALLGLMIATLFSLLGCGTSKPTPVIEEKYPVRTDWLLREQIPGDPMRGPEVGYPPTSRLDSLKATKIEPVDGDDLLLFKSPFFNTRTIDPEVRDEMGKVLTDLFGTPAKPTMPHANDAVRTIFENIEKLPAKRMDRDQKQTELGELRKKETTPENKQAITSAESDFTKLQDEIRTAEALVEDKLEVFRVLPAELRLDAPTLEKGAVVYRNYCQQCHGLTGDGNGPGGKYLLPLPRDYRQGLFKFVRSHPSTGETRKPLRSDLKRTIVNGMDGSPMPQFASLNKDEIEAVTSYVIHLSIRGEAEYAVLRYQAKDPDDPMGRDEVRRRVTDQAALSGWLWLRSNRNPLVPDANPYTTEKQIQESAANGYVIFKENCMKCHVDFGRASPFQYDLWGTIVKPRNLTVATMRGGRDPEALYARIFGGIQGSKMPVFSQFRPTEEDRAKGVDKIWDLVHFVMYLGESEKRQLLRDQFQIEIDP